MMSKMLPRGHYETGKDLDDVSPISFNVCQFCMLTEVPQSGEGIKRRAYAMLLNFGAA